MSDLKMKIKKMRPNAILPEYQTSGAAGADFCACIDEPVTIKPGEFIRIPTGVGVEIPVGYELQIRPRSGLGCKYGVTMVNGIGTIDSDYRGEMSVTLINFGKQDFTIEPDMRIAQMVVAKCEHIIWQEVEELSETERGTGGLGSTGTKRKR